jgi:hypothetical protein
VCEGVGSVEKYVISPTPQISKFSITKITKEKLNVNIIRKIVEPKKKFLESKRRMVMMMMLLIIPS